MIPQGLFRIAATARFITENHPGVLNKVKAEVVEVEKSVKTPDEGGQKLEKEAHKPSSNPQAVVLPSLEEAPVLKKLVPLEPTVHLEISPIQTVPAKIVGDCSQDFTHISYGNCGPYPRIQQLDTSGSDRIYSIPSPKSYQKGLPWETLGGLNKDKSGNKPPPQSSTLEYPIILSRVLGSSNDDMDTMTPGLQCNHPSYVNGFGMTLSNAQSVSYSSTTTARNPFSSPVPTLPKPSVGFSGTLSQGPPRFGTVNILHPMDQLAGLNNTSLPPHTPETFSVNPQQSLFDGRDSTPVQLMPIMPNATQMLYRIPGLTTLWPEIGNVGIHTGQKPEDPNKTNI